MIDFQHPWGWTSTAPLLCAIHCVATPVAAAFAPALADAPALEWGLFGATAFLAAAALAAGLREHGDPRPLYAVLFGLAAWTASLVHVFHPVPYEISTMAASLTTATGLLWNARLHCGLSSACSACEHESGAETVGPVTAVEKPISG